MTKINSCQFCNSEDVHPVNIQPWDLYTINCDSCGARGPLKTTVRVATESWNVALYKKFEEKDEKYSEIKKLTKRDRDEIYNYAIKRSDEILNGG